MKHNRIEKKIQKIKYNEHIQAESDKKQMNKMFQVSSPPNAKPNHTTKNRICLYFFE